MAKFLNKKEQVIDFKLTSYGKHMLSEGVLKPTFYAFFDDNVIYDGTYVGRSEEQNKIQNRIKDNTQYLESQVLFEEVEKLDFTNLTIDSDSGYDRDADRQIVFKNTKKPTINVPRKDIFRLEQMIGDAFLEGDTQNAPAWNIVTLSGEISSSFQKETAILSSSFIELEIPQINIDLNYSLKINNPGTFELSSPDFFNSQPQVVNSLFYNNGEYITLETDHMLLYAEEINTILLNKNFEVEVFEITGSEAGFEDVLLRKDFVKDYSSLNGANITEEYLENVAQGFVEPTNDNVEYFFSIFKDQRVDEHLACKGIEIYNKESYYIDIDFDCDKDQTSEVYYDIYGPVTEPEVCQ